MMNKSESKYFNTARKIDEAFLSLLDKKAFEYISVKEICEKAGVNRSTFYLHYETLDDLLTECNEYMIKKFFESTGVKEIKKADIKNMQTNELILLTPEYVLPYLEFIKQNKTMFKTYIGKFASLTVKKNDVLLYNNILYPILERFNVCREDKKYILSFYFEGALAIVKEWVKNDCKDDTSHICDIIIKCVNYEN